MARTAASSSSAVRRKQPQAFARGSVTRTKRSAPEPQTRFLPPAASNFLWRRCIEALGLVPICFSVLIILSLVSYSPTDPSWNVATDAPVQNWLGVIGSHSADVLMQVLGLSAVAPVLILFGWGLRIVRHMGLPRFLLHFAMTPIATVLCAIGLAILPTPDSWPLAAGLGGLAGHTVLSKLVAIISPWGVPVSVWVYGLVFWPLSVLAVMAAMALPMQDWRTAGRLIKQAFWNAAFGSGRGTLSVTRRLFQLWKSITARRTKSDTPEDSDTQGTKEPTVSLPGKSKIDAHEGSGGEDEKPIKVATLQKTKTKPGQRAQKEAQPELSFEGGESALPPLALLKATDAAGHIQHDPDTLENNARMLEGVLDDFGVQGDISEVRPGPVVTVYELEPAKGTKTSRVIGLSDDIARSMSAISVRAAVVPGRSVIGVEIPNVQRETVYLREMLASHAFETAPGALNVVLGKDIEGQPVIADLAKMPHVLVAGTTGSGKSVGVNAMILSLLYQYTPEELRLIMVDPKILELSVYDDIPHLLTPVVTEPGKAVVALKWAVREMDDRYRQMAQLGVRNVTSFNERLREADARGETLTREVQTGFDPETHEPIIEVQELDLEPLPFIVIIVDEFADLMMMAGKDVEACVLRIAQKARAAGIHLIMATQRPSVDVVTGTIKANFPSRISYQVTSKVDSRTILGQQGAEQLLGMGDMLYMSAGGRLTRVHGPFVSDGEVEKVADFLRTTGAPNYITSVVEEDEQFGGNPDDPLFASSGDGEDDLYLQAVAIVRKHKKASTSFVQRHLKIGYNRAARLIEQMEDEGLITPANHVGKREILMDVE